MKHSSNSAQVPTLVRDHFRKAASSFDSLYEDDSALQRLVRPGLFARRAAAEKLVRSYKDPHVLDIGCGSARVGEHLLDCGASRYVGVDFSEPMLQLARERLQRFGAKVEFHVGDFLETPLEGTFDVITGLGLFDYIADPVPFARRMRELCRGTVMATFPRWNWYKGPIRHLRYEVINNCPIYDYTERELRFLFSGSGFSKVNVEVASNGFLVRASA